MTSTDEAEFQIVPDPDDVRLSQEVEGLDYAELEVILADWHPAIAQAIAESWNMSEELVNALETQLEPDPALRETASLAEVLSAARLILQHETSGNSLDASEYPLLLRLGIANHGENSVTLGAHAEEIDLIRQGLSA